MNEQALIAQLREPQTRNAAFDTLVRMYQKPLYYQIRRLVASHDDADDILQNTFVSAWRNIEKFRGDAAMKTWLYRIATNEALTFLQNQKKRATQDLSEVENLPLQSAPTQIDSAIIQAKLQQAIALLPDKQKLVFNMRYYDEMSFKEISEILETSEGGLKANYHHAVKKIEAFITGHEWVYE